MTDRIAAALERARKDREPWTNLRGERYARVPWPAHDAALAVIEAAKCEGYHGQDCLGTCETCRALVAWADAVLGPPAG